MKAFYDSLNLVDSIFSSKVIILLNNRINYLDIQRPLVFRCYWYGHQNWPKELHTISGSEKIASPRFHAVSFVRK